MEAVTLPLLLYPLAIGRGNPSQCFIFVQRGYKIVTIWIQIQIRCLHPFINTNKETTRPTRIRILDHRICIVVSFFLDSNSTGLVQNPLTGLLCHRPWPSLSIFNLCDEETDMKIDFIRLPCDHLSYSDRMLISSGLSNMISRFCTYHNLYNTHSICIIDTSCFWDNTLNLPT